MISPLQNKKKVTEMRMILDDSRDQISEMEHNHEKWMEWKKSAIELNGKESSGWRPSREKEIGVDDK